MHKTILNASGFMNCYHSFSSPLRLWPGQGVEEQLLRRRKMKSEKSPLSLSNLYTHTHTHTHSYSSMIEEALAKEKARRLKAQRSRGTRHSSFGGTFVVKNQKSISGKERVYHRPLAGKKQHSTSILPHSILHSHIIQRPLVCDAPHIPYHMSIINNYLPLHCTCL